MTEEGKKQRLQELELEWEKYKHLCKEYWDLWQKAAKQLDRVKKEIDNL